MPLKLCFLLEGGGGGGEGGIIMYTSKYGNCLMICGHALQLWTY